MRLVHVLGVVNTTPDSFSDGGKFLKPEAAIDRARQLVRDGATTIDVGGESTRPGAAPVERSEELSRVLPVIEALTADGVTVSIDTIHAETAAAAVTAGAKYINDVSGGLHDPDMLAVAARAARDAGVTFIIGHWRGIPDPSHERSSYTDVVAEVCAALQDRVEAALHAGVDRSKIVIDPGLGFDKTSEQGWEILRRLEELHALGYPVLIGASRKRMIAEVLADEVRELDGARDLATAVVSAYSARAGAWGVRVHDVASTTTALAVDRAWRSHAPSTVAPGLTPPTHPSRPRDTITLTGLEVFAHHGVFAFEREQGQKFLIDAEVTVDVSRAVSGDDLAQTVHYGELAEAIKEAVERDPVDLIETLAERVAGVALSFPGVFETRITVHKPDAPIDAEFSDVSVSIVRAKSIERAKSIVRAKAAASDEVTT